MSAELLRELLQAAAALSAAVLMVALLRRPLRRLVGAEAAYRAWLLVPAAVLAVWLPAPALPPVQVTAAAVGAVSLMPVAPAVAPAADPAPWLLALWLAGVGLFAMVLVLRQRRFARRIRRQRSQPYDVVEGDGPAVVGLWRARVVLPEDFERRYSIAEQRLILAHEQAHVRRGDLQAQLLASALRSLFWFNPLAHIGAALFRFDQELACDAAVLAQFPTDRRRYADAMLKTRLAEYGLPLACHWQSTHSLKERISMLKQPLPTSARRAAGALLTLGLLVGGSYAAWAAQPGVAAAAPSAPFVDVAMQVSIDGGTPSAPRVVARLGEPFALAMGEGASAWRIELTARDEGKNAYEVDGSITRGDRVISQPKIRVTAGKPLTIDVTTPEGDARFTLVMTLSPSNAAGPNAVPPPSAMGIVSKIGDGDHLSPPAYPPEAKAKGIAGKVMLALLVGVDGSMKDVRVISAEPAGIFERASVDAARTWRLHPATKDGKAIESWVKIPVQFAPEDPDKPTTSYKAGADDRHAVALGEAPTYPADALAKKISGKVVMDLSYDAEGRPTAVELVSSEPAGVFDAAAVAAAWKWHVNPQQVNGKPVAGRVRVPMTFLPDDAHSNDPAPAKS